MQGKSKEEAEVAFMEMAVDAEERVGVAGHVVNHGHVPGEPDQGDPGGGAAAHGRRGLGRRVGESGHVVANVDLTKIYIQGVPRH